jgi:hypothetical protein
MVQLMKATGPVFPSRFHKVENVYINNQLRPVIDVANSNFCLAYFSPALNLMLGLNFTRDVKFRSQFLHVTLCGETHQILRHAMSHLI